MLLPPAATQERQRSFWATVDEVAPEVARALREIALPPYLAAVAAGGHGEDPAEADAWVPVLVAILDWGERVSLTDYWHRSVAWATLHLMAADPEINSFAIPAGQARGSYPFVFEDSGWDVARETREEAKERMQAAFQGHLSGYLDGIEGEFRARGWVPPRPTRAKRGRYMEWLVRWQCQGWTKQRIAEEYGADKREVDREVKRVADELELRLRRGKPGRPGRG